MRRSEREAGARTVDANASVAGRTARTYEALPTARKRAARAAVGAVFFVNGATFATWAARVPAIREGLGLSPGGLSVALTGLAAAAFAGLPLAGMLVARWGSRRVLTGAALYLAALPLIALAPGLVWLAAVLAVFAIGNSTLDVAMNTQGALVERAYARPLMGSFHAMFSLGGVVGAAFGGVAADLGVSVRSHFLLTVVVLSFVLAVATVFLLPDVPSGDAAGLTLALPDRRLFAPGLIAFCALMGEGMMNDWSTVYLHDVADTSKSTAATGFSVFSAGMVVGRLAADRIQAHLGPDRFVLACGLLASSGSALAVAVPTPAAGMAAYALIGLGLAAIIPVTFSHAARQPHRAPGPSIAAVSTVGYVGFLAGPPIVGAVAQTTGLRAAMLLFLVLTTVMVCLAPRLRTVQARPAAAGPQAPPGHPSSNGSGTRKR